MFAQHCPKRGDLALVVLALDESVREFLGCCEALCHAMFGNHLIYAAHFLLAVVFCADG